jgi:hypothetical protein
MSRSATAAERNVAVDALTKVAKQLADGDIAEAQKTVDEALDYIEGYDEESS